MLPSAYRHIFFDLDGTVTRSRSLITPEMRSALLSLLESGRDVIIVSGAEVQQGRSQTEDVPILYLGQNGNHAYDGKAQIDLWRERLSDEEKAQIYAHIKSIPVTWDVENKHDTVEDRGSQISYSLLGHHEAVPKKEAFDPGGKRRAQILKEHPLNSETVEVVIGGTTCFDYIRKGLDKGHNVTRLIQEKKWQKEECVYVGDALYPGGNDEKVLGVIDTKQVADPEETLRYIKEILGV